MPTLTSYFGFLLAVLTITAGIFISLNKIRLIWFAILRWIGNFRIFRIFSLSYDQFLVIEIHGQYKFIFKDRYYPHLFYFQPNSNDWSFSIWNRVRSNSYYFGWIICNGLFTIPTWRSVGYLIYYCLFCLLTSYFFVLILIDRKSN